MIAYDSVQFKGPNRYVGGISYTYKISDKIYYMQKT